MQGGGAGDEFEVYHRQPITTPISCQRQAPRFLPGHAVHVDAGPEPIGQDPQAHELANDPDVQGHGPEVLLFRDFGEQFQPALHERLVAKVVFDVVQEITGARQVHMVGLCLGATMAAVLLSHLARTKAGRERIGSATLLNALVDFSEPGPLGHFVDPNTVTRLEQRMAKRGYLDAREMAGTFNLLRANDLVWRYVASSWLMGDDPPSFDILQWNEDSTRMPARMHSEYLRRLYQNNELAVGSYVVDDRPIALTDIRTPVFAVGTETDHIAPWRSVYKTHLFTDNELTFVLTNGGHNAGVVSEPGHADRHYHCAIRSPGARYVDSDTWFALSRRTEGSWWPEWAVWLERYSNSQRCQPPAMGAPANGIVPLCSAPGVFVRQT